MNANDIGSILSALPRVTIGVVGDLAVDRYWTVDPALRDASRETGLPIRHVVDVKARPGGAGTVVNQAHALGVGRVVPVGVLGDDADALFLRAEFSRMGLRTDFVLDQPGRCTPSYNRVVTLPDLRETERSDVFPRSPLPREVEDALIRTLEEAASTCDAVVVSDYTEQARPGVVTPRVCEAVSDLGRRAPDRPLIVDSRLRASGFHHVHLKMNLDEFRALTGDSGDEPGRIGTRGRDLARREGRLVLVTLGARGLVVCEPDRFVHVPGFTVEGETDIVGAGDAVLGAVAASLATGADAVTAGLLGVLASSITVQQVRTTGVATPDQVIERWRAWQALHGDLFWRGGIA